MPAERFIARSKVMRALAEQIRRFALAETGNKPAYLEGYDQSGWVLVDYFDFIVHVFTPDQRAFYGLERLWGNAEHVTVPPAR